MDTYIHRHTWRYWDPWRRQRYRCGIVIPGSDIVITGDGIVQSIDILGEIDIVGGIDVSGTSFLRTGVTLSTLIRDASFLRSLGVVECLFSVTICVCTVGTKDASVCRPPPPLRGVPRREETVVVLDPSGTHGLGGPTVPVPLIALPSF